MNITKISTCFLFLVFAQASQGQTEKSGYRDVSSSKKMVDACLGTKPPSKIGGSCSQLPLDDWKKLGFDSNANIDTYAKHPFGAVSGFCKALIDIRLNNNSKNEQQLDAAIENIKKEGDLSNVLKTFLNSVELNINYLLAMSDPDNKTVFLPGTSAGRQGLEEARYTHVANALMLLELLRASIASLNCDPGLLHRKISTKISSANLIDSDLKKQIARAMAYYVEKKEAARAIHNKLLKESKK